MRITRERIREDLRILYSLSSDTYLYMCDMFDREDLSANAGMSDDKYNSYLYAQYLEYAMITLEKSDDSYERLLNDSKNLDYKVLDLLNHIGTQDLTISFLRNEIDMLFEQLCLKRVRVRRISDEEDDSLILYRAGSGG